MKWFKQIKSKLFPPKLFPPKPPLYPCIKCWELLGGNKCGKICDKVEMNDSKLLYHIMQFKSCPDCDGTKFYEGPSAGLTTNIQCLTCGHEFNNGAPFIFERI
jgi:hypothetical protein